MNLKMMIKDLRSTCIKQILKYKFDCKFKSNVYIDNNSVINGYINVEDNTKIMNSVLEKGTNIGRFNVFEKCHIGKFCIIGDQNRNIYGHHPTQNVSMHSFFYSPQKHGYAEKELFPKAQLYKYADKNKTYYNIIGNDVYLTNNVLLLEGVRIGDGAIVTPGSVVTKNVPAYAIVRGNPAKIITYRFKTNEIMFLEKLKWWDKDDEWLRSHVDDFGDIKKLMARVITEEKWDENDFSG